MDKNKILNLKKQIFSLKFCYEEQLIQIKSLIIKVHNLLNLFKITKNYIKEKRKNDLNFQNDKKFILIINQKKNLLKNIEKQSKILSKSIIYNKYQELQKEKETLIQELEEKKNHLNSLKNDLNTLKLSYSYRGKISKIYLNDSLDSIYNSLIKKDLYNLISKEKINLQKKCEDAYKQMKTLYNDSLIKYRYIIKEKGFKSCILNKKNNRTYIFNVEPIKNEKKNSSDDSDSEDNDNNNDIKDKSNSIDDHIFDMNNKSKTYLNKSFFGANRKNNNKNRYLHNSTCFKNNDININTINKDKFNNNYKLGLNNTNIITFPKYQLGLVTEVNNRTDDQLNKKLLKIKETYYKCLDQRYELKNSLKSNISHIYKMKEKIKKFKKENFLNK